MGVVIRCAKLKMSLVLMVNDRELARMKKKKPHFATGNSTYIAVALTVGLWREQLMHATVHV